MSRRSVAVLSVVLAGCGASADTASQRLPADYRPVRAGRTPAYRLPSLSRAAARRRPIDGLRCTRHHGALYGVHIELYARRLVLPVPAGIGVASPRRTRGAYVLAGACSYPVRTFEPTGVLVVDVGASPTLANLFAVWGQPLTAHAMAGFRGPVFAYVNGRKWAGNPATIPLRRHAEIVLEIGGDVPPHPAYLFPPGL